MKLQELTESLKVGLDEQSTLSSKLTDTTKFIEELRKEIEVTDRTKIIILLCSYINIHIANNTYLAIAIYVCSLAVSTVTEPAV